MAFPPRGSFDRRTGVVTLYDYHKAMMTALGAEVASVPTLQAVVVSGEKPAEVSRYVVKMDGVKPPPSYDGVPIVFAAPQTVVYAEILPRVVVMFESADFDGSRWQTAAMSYIVPNERAGYATKIVNGETVDVPKRYDFREAPLQLDISYSITMYCGGDQANTELLRMRAHLLRKLPPRGLLTVIDSLGEARQYDCLCESFPNSSELAGLNRRVAALTASYIVKGEEDIGIEGSAGAAWEGTYFDFTVRGDNEDGHGG